MIRTSLLILSILAVTPALSQPLQVCKTPHEIGLVNAYNQAHNEAAADKVKPCKMIETRNYDIKVLEASIPTDDIGEAAKLSINGKIAYANANLIYLMNHDYRAKN